MGLGGLMASRRRRWSAMSVTTPVRSRWKSVP